MIQISEADIEQARDLIAHGTPEAVGYKILIKPIDAITTMTNAECEEFATLASLNFQDKSHDQTDRLSKGTQHGILAHIGPGAFSFLTGGSTESLTPFKAQEVAKLFPKEGEVIIFDRYCGVEMELPPGSGNKYRFANDEALLGRMVKTNG